MCKLREASDCKRVTKVVVVTDNPGPLAPGKRRCGDLCVSVYPFLVPRHERNLPLLSSAVPVLPPG